MQIEDIFDYRYLINDGEILVLIEKPDGEEWEFEIEKEENEDLGLEFAESLMDGYKKRIQSLPKFSQSNRDYGKALQIGKVPCQGFYAFFQFNAIVDRRIFAIRKWSGHGAFVRR